MHLKNNKGSFWALIAVTGFAAVAPGCGDGDETASPKGGTGGTATGGTSGKAGSAGTGGDTGGSAGLGGSAGKAGSSGSAGKAGSAGSAGTAGTAGTAGEGGLGGEGGQGGGEGGQGGGEGGQGGVQAVTIYDFESGLQGWVSDTSGTTVAVSVERQFDGVQSLKITSPVLDNANYTVVVNKPEVATNGPMLWPGAVLTFHAFLPTAFYTSGEVYFQAITKANNYKIFDTSGNSSKTPMQGAWTTWTYTVPNTFPGGLQALGFQIGDAGGGTTVQAGDAFVDAITMTPGTANCAIATPTQAHGFETVPLDPEIYKRDGSDADTVVSQSMDHVSSGANSWKVDFTALPAPAPSGFTTRRVFIDKPNLYCGQTVTVHVWLPTGSEGMTFQIFVQYNNFEKFGGSALPATVTRDGFTTLTYTIPASGADAVGPGGIQTIGVQFLWNGTTAFTGPAYIDDVTWGP